ncbi:MAG TPA: hypothetical protein VFD41_05955 [Actinomycetales bacterium]|nr:hypothetical protein [Actinomycetales bacterium]
MRLVTGRCDVERSQARRVVDDDTQCQQRVDHRVVDDLDLSRVGGRQALVTEQRHAAR